jgi:hypothetical protein
VRVVVDPTLPANFVCDRFIHFTEVAAVFRKKDERFVKDLISNTILLPIGTVVRIWAPFAVFCGHGFTQLI